MNYDFTSFSTGFQSYQDVELIMKGCMRWNLVYDFRDPRLKRVSDPGPLDQQGQRLTHRATGAPL